MKKFCFLFLTCLFSVFLSKAQKTVGYVDFCGYVYYEVENGATVLHWKDTCGNALYYQIHVKLSGIGWTVLDSVSGQDSSYVLPNYSDSIYKGEVFYLLAFYNKKKTGKSKEFYLAETQTYIDTSTRILYTNYQLGRTSQGMSRGIASGIENFSFSLENFTDVVLAWNIAPSAGSIQFFRIERNGNMIAELPSIERTYTDGNLVLGYYIYTLQVYYDDGTIEVANLEVEIYPSVPMFSYTWDNNNNLVLKWDVTADGIPPTSFKLVRGDEYLATIGFEDGIYTYAHTIINPTVGIFTYHLFTNYATGGATVTSLTVEVELALVENFTATVENLSNVFLAWNVPHSGVRPQSYQIKRNGIFIETLEGNASGYFDVNLEHGNYYYEFSVYYDNGTTLHFDDNVLIEEITYDTPSNFRYDTVNNDVILMWDTLTGGLQPSFYRIKRNGRIIWDLPPHKYRYYNADLDTGTYSYELFAHYSNGFALEIGSLTATVSTKVEKIYVSLDSNFICVIEGNAVRLSWDVEVEAVPISFQVERDGEIVKTVDGNTFTYLDADAKVGINRYNLLTIFQGSPYLVVKGILRCKAGGGCD